MRNKHTLTRKGVVSANPRDPHPGSSSGLRWVRCGTFNINPEKPHYWPSNCGRITYRSTFVLRANLEPF